jgi:Holliday junction resolvasome, helicase subunit
MAHSHPEAANAALDLLSIDHVGLDSTDRKILQHVIESFGGGPVGASTLAAALQQEVQTLEDVHEPFLLQVGFLQRTPRGRIATEAAYRHLGIDPPGESLLQ